MRHHLYRQGVLPPGIDNSTTGADCTTQCYLKCLSFNARSIVNKLPEFHLLLSNDRPDVVCIVETFLCNGITDAIVVGGNNYNIYRHDRQSVYRHGGVLILTNNNTVSSAAVSVPPQFADVEVVAVDIIGSSFSYRFINCYRPPDISDSNPHAVNYVNKLIAVLQFLSCTDASLIVVGDFNLPAIHWSSELPSQPVDCADLDDNNPGCCRLFSNYLQCEGLFQFVNSPTRYDPGSHVANLLDLVISNDIFSVTNLNVGAPFSTSDHCSIQFDVLYTDAQYNRSFTQADFSHADWAVVNQYLCSVDWTSVVDVSNSIESRFSKFYDVLGQCVEQCVPTRTINSSTGSRAQSKKVHHPAHITKLFVRKRRAWRLYKRFKTPQLLAKFKLAANTCRAAIYENTIRKEEKLIEGGNLGKFYRYCNKSLRSRTNVGSIKLNDGSLTNDPALKANCINDYFSSVYTKDNGVIPLPPAASAAPHTPRCELSHVNITSHDVYNQLRKLNSRSSGGPDHIPPVFLKHCAPALANPLASLFQSSFDTGYLPDIWRMAFVTPVYKKGESSLPSNYRPISLTCTCCKVMESIIKNSMLKYLKDNNIISTQQHGFLSKHSTSTNLLECVQDWIVKLNCRLPVDVVYVDFSRAFDSVVHSKLKAKLESIGVNGPLLNWINSFLSFRRQCTVVDHCCSHTTDVKSGVIQGSCIGPLLFILFINDITHVFSSEVTCKLYADDLKLYSSFSMQDSAHDNSISEALRDLANWADQWQLSINIAKCHVLHLGRNNPRFSYCINNIRIDDNGGYVTDLGVDIDPGLRFDMHIKGIIAKAYQRIALIFRGFQSRQPDLLVRAYVSFVRPLLEYCSCVWSPVLHKHVNAIERVQKYFTRKLYNMQDISYLDRLAALNMESLEMRRLKLDLCMYYKIMHNFIALPVDLYFHFDDRNLTTRYYDPNNLLKPMLKTRLSSQNFFNRCIDAWNSISLDIRSADSFIVFKRALQTIDFSCFMIGQYST